MKDKKPIDCFQCKNFYVTWDANAPRGCKAFGFKTRRLPSEVVFESSGEECLMFKPKHPTPRKNPKKDGWIA
ncbi:uracil-DNA glycosylase [Thiomicrorhabdus sediminis]|uniref:Uracil-DNA glycosylase n=1 Tax=Thiomicrorhabdus sediminis TaxID=2580412 RepID=A0A4P9K4Z1_9GAMM|nr:uracil-DNA glycosylase [Thiomicrorhabdus sediminis]QCU90029.1 uracil-DNA glycosylase [Thiomicrorhabdus sediminis]